MTNGTLVLRKVATLREHVARARRRRGATAAGLRADVDAQDALAMSVLVAIQEAADIAFHVVADEAWGVPASYADGFEMLAAHGLITGELASELGRAAGLRNRLAHGYAGVDVERLWAELPAGLDALERYGAVIAGFAGGG